MDRTLAFLAHFAKYTAEVGVEFLPPPFNTFGREALEQINLEAQRRGQSVDEIMAHAEATYPLVINKIDDFQQRLERDAQLGRQ